MSRRPLPVVDTEVEARLGEGWRTLPPEVVGVDVDRLITLRSPEDVAERRERLVQHLWKGAGLPTRRPELTRDVELADLEPLDAAGTDRLTLTMRHGVTATVYRVHPRHPVPGRFACFLAGHGNGRQPKYHQPQLQVMQTLLDRGYVVAGVDMPLQGWNAPFLEAPDGSRVEARSHEVFDGYETAGFSAATFFIEPVVALLNQAADEAPLSSVVTVGFSGGAWTTVLHAAVDPRVTLSVQVAGTWPFYLRPHPASHPNFGDWEQRRESMPELYAIAGYLDLYVLGAVGPGRRQLQVINRFDPSCFQGVGHRSYAQPVRDRAAALGGDWEVVDDPTHGLHQVSPYTVSLLAHELDQLHPAPPAV
ncbi:hypothetical protein [Desertihabitans aurantiacus]|uniref:hypothetical protein n=1 Tax=Desertihabitans aurantiacus TaxID=2282477 RepID=UPI0013003B41|nr:hypothetical protein [Desertihabitans aurantiacus]